jgi:hypothetical protein
MAIRDPEGLRAAQKRAGKLEDEEEADEEMDEDDKKKKKNQRVSSGKSSGSGKTQKEAESGVSSPNRDNNVVRQATGLRAAQQKKQEKQAAQDDDRPQPDKTGFNPVKVPDRSDQFPETEKELRNRLAQRDDISRQEVKRVFNTGIASPSTRRRVSQAAEEELPPEQLDILLVSSDVREKRRPKSAQKQKEDLNRRPVIRDASGQPIASQVPQKGELEDELGKPETRKQAEIQEQLAFLRFAEEGGFTRKERQTAELGKTQIEQAEAIDQAVRRQRKAERELDAQLANIESTIEALQQERSANIDVQFGGENVSREEALRRLRRQKNKIQQQRQEAKEKLGGFVNKRQEQISILEQAAKGAVQSDPMQGVTDRSAFEQLSTVEKAGFSIKSTLASSRGFDIAAQSLSGDTQETREKVLQEFGRQRRDPTDTPSEFVSEFVRSAAGTLSTAFVGGAAIQGVVRGTAAVAGAKAGKIAQRGVQVAGAGIIGLEATRIGSKAAAGKTDEAFADILRFGTATAGFAAGAKAVGPIGQTPTAKQPRELSRTTADLLQRNRLSELPESELPRFEQTPFRGGRTVGPRPQETRAPEIRDFATGRRFQKQRFLAETGSRTDPIGRGEPGEGFTRTEIEVLQSRADRPGVDQSLGDFSVSTMESGRVTGFDLGRVSQQQGGITAQTSGRGQIRMTESGTFQLRQPVESGSISQTLGLNELTGRRSRRGQLQLQTELRRLKDTNRRFNENLLTRTTEKKIPRLRQRTRPRVEAVGTTQQAARSLQLSIGTVPGIETDRSQSDLTRDIGLTSPTFQVGTFSRSQTRFRQPTRQRQAQRQRQKIAFDVPPQPDLQVAAAGQRGPPPSTNKLSLTRQTRQRLPTRRSTRLSIPRFESGGRRSQVRIDTGDLRISSDDGVTVPQVDLLSAFKAEASVGKATTPTEKDIIKRFERRKETLGPLASLKTLEEIKGRTETDNEVQFF